MTSPSRKTPEHGKYFIALKCGGTHKIWGQFRLQVWMASDITFGNQRGQNRTRYLGGYYNSLLLIKTILEIKDSIYDRHFISILLPSRAVNA